MSVEPIPLSYPGGINSLARVDTKLKTPIYLLGVGVSLLTQHFGNADRVVLEKSSFVWKQDQIKSQVYISYRDNLDYEVIGKRPAIIASLGDMAFPRDAIGDILSYDNKTGRYDITDRSESSWEFTCISDKPLEAASLATEIKYFFQTYRKYIAQTYGFDMIRTKMIAKYSKQPEYKDYYGNLVVVEFSCQDNFSVGAESLKVAGIQLDFQD
jgi:hypothetical protein